MTNKKPESKNNPTSAKDKAQASNRKANNTTDKTALAANSGRNEKKLLPSGVVDEYKVDLLPLGDLEQIREYIQDAWDLFTKIADNNLTPVQRRRKIGAGVRNYGFIEKVADLAEANPQYAQFFDPNDLRNAIMNFDLCRNVAVQLQSYLRDVTNTMLIYSNEGFIMSSMFYNTVKEMSRRGDSTANSLFRTLQPFFKRPRRPNTKTTMKQAEHDFEGLLKGTKEGSILIENIGPKITGGERKIIDNVRKGSLTVKEQENFKETE